MIHSYSYFPIPSTYPSYATGLYIPKQIWTHTYTHTLPHTSPYLYIFGYELVANSDFSISFHTNIQGGAKKFMIESSDFLLNFFSMYENSNIC